MVISIVDLTCGSRLDDFWTLKEILNKLKIFWTYVMNAREKNKHLNKEARKFWVEKHDLGVPEGRAEPSVQFSRA